MCGGGGGGGMRPNTATSRSTAQLSCAFASTTLSIKINELIENDHLKEQVMLKRYNLTGCIKKFLPALLDMARNSDMLIHQ